MGGGVQEYCDVLPFLANYYNLNGHMEFRILELQTCTHTHTEGKVTNSQHINRHFYKLMG